MGIIGPIRECYADRGHGPLIVNNSNNLVANFFYWGLNLNLIRLIIKVGKFLFVIFVL